MNNGIGMIINGRVAILLVLTIGYCMLLNRRLKLLKSDEHSLRATISELVTATDIAERAIAGLKLTVEECEVDLEAGFARSISVRCSQLRVAPRLLKHGAERSMLDGGEHTS